ncbi:MAG: hypothetical protein US49_C0001G0041 [candidate division TM6 bacterium GW2011_GWF2_37_49]|nr:MAG: hypothetical protein US49_C0001G0041 [candidate division TM6 bacterium GW2011_GWF2_37_49]
MINFLNRKNLFALLLTVACVNASSALGAASAPAPELKAATEDKPELKAAKKIMTSKHIELGSAVARDLAILIEMRNKGKFGADSKQAIISGTCTDLARLLNDVTAMYNASNPKTHPILTNLVGVAPVILLDLIDAVTKIKKLYKKEYSLTNDKSSVKVSKLVARINKIAPILEMSLATLRAGLNYTGNAYAIKLCTAALTLTRAAQFYAQDSKKTAYAVALIIVCAFITDHVYMLTQTLTKKPASSPVDTSPAKPDIEPGTELKEVPTTEVDPK